MKKGEVKLHNEHVLTHERVTSRRLMLHLAKATPFPEEGCGFLSFPPELARNEIIMWQNRFDNLLN